MSIPQELTLDQMEQISGGSYDALHLIRVAVKTQCGVLKRKGKSMQEAAEALYSTYRSVFARQEFDALILSLWDEV